MTINYLNPLLKNIENTHVILAATTDKTSYHDLFRKAWECAGEPCDVDPVAFGERVFCEVTEDCAYRKQAIMKVLWEHELRTEGPALRAWVESADQSEDENRIEASDRILAFKNRSKNERLDLSQLNLSSLPNIFDAPFFRNHLVELFLEGNRLTQLPETITSLTKLVTLSVHNNALTEIPNLSHLPDLIDLLLTDNQFTEIPSWLYTWRPTEYLYMAGNPLTTPPQISRKMITYNSLTFEEHFTCPNFTDELVALPSLSPQYIDHYLLQAITLLSKEEDHHDEAHRCLEELVTSRQDLKNKLLPDSETLLLRSTNDEDLLVHLKSILIKHRLGDFYSLLKHWVDKGEETGDYEIRKHAQQVIEDYVLDPALTNYTLLLSGSDDDKLKTLPDIFQAECFKSILHLDLSQNDLDNLPHSFKALTQLNSIDLSDNNFSEFPDVFEEFLSLEDLDISDNKLESLPDSMGKLSSLTILTANKNCLDTLPASFGDLTNLTELYLYENQFSEFPRCIEQFSSLERLDLSINSIRAIPHFIENCLALKFLYLTENQLESVSPSIGKLSSLITLDLRKNELTSLPDFNGNLSSLEILDLTENRLAMLPASLQYLCSLRTLYVTNNPDLIVPVELLDNFFLRVVH
jgi:Leucine-rich repeat (LRR) protein